MEIKKCKSCLENKELIYNFYKRSSTGGYYHICNECRKSPTYQKSKKEEMIALLQNNEKRCNNCNEIKILDKYHNDVRSSGGKSGVCKSCVGIKTSENKFLIKNTRLQREYGITLEDYNQMYIKINGSCEICNKFFKILSVDHCHETGQVRGLLCQKCNSGLGILGDNITSIENALLYLKKSKT